ncbi:hypothetical protein LINPERPRIM_LOCUS37081, partial [Linum perenne]
IVEGDRYGLPVTYIDDPASQSFQSKIRSFLFEQMIIEEKMNHWKEEKVKRFHHGYILIREKIIRRD